MRLNYWTWNQTETTSYVAEAWKKNFRHILIKHYITFEFEYLSKFEFILENLLGYETGSQMGSIDKKKTINVKNLVQMYL